MTTMASQITSPKVVYSAVYSDADQRKHQSTASLAFVWGVHRDRWIPRTKGQLRGKCFHLMTLSWWWPPSRPAWCCAIYNPTPVASEHRWLVKAPGWIHSVPDVSGRWLWRCGCHVRLWNLHDVTNSSPGTSVCKHFFLALSIDKMLSVEAQIGLLWRSFCSSSYRVWD